MSAPGRWNRLQALLTLSSEPVGLPRAWGTTSAFLWMGWSPQAGLSPCLTSSTSVLLHELCALASGTLPCPVCEPCFSQLFKIPCLGTITWSITCLPGDYLSEHFNPRLVFVHLSAQNWLTQPHSSPAAMCSGDTHVSINLMRLRFKSQSVANLTLIPCKTNFELFGEIKLWF